MSARFTMVGIVLGALLAGPAMASGAQGAMGIAVGNTVTADYGADGKLTANFHSDGTVDFVFPDGNKSHQQWIANKDFFCMIRPSDPGTRLSYRCERNTVKGKKLGESWQTVDSEGKKMTVIVRRSTS